MSGVDRYRVQLNELVTPSVKTTSAPHERDVVLARDYDTLRTANQRLEGEVARLKADSARYQFLKENCQQDVDGYRNETPVLVHALSHIPEWRNRIDETIDAALAGAGGDENAS